METKSNPYAAALGCYEEYPGGQSGTVDEFLSWLEEKSEEFDESNKQS